MKTPLYSVESYWKLINKCHEYGTGVYGGRIRDVRVPVVFSDAGDGWFRYKDLKFPDYFVEDLLPGCDRFTYDPWVCEDLDTLKESFKVLDDYEYGVILVTDAKKLSYGKAIELGYTKTNLDISDYIVALHRTCIPNTTALVRRFDSNSLCLSLIFEESKMLYTYKEDVLNGMMKGYMYSISSFILESIPNPIKFITWYVSDENLPVNVYLRDCRDGEVEVIIRTV